MTAGLVAALALGAWLALPTPAIAAACGSGLRSSDEKLLQAAKTGSFADFFAATAAGADPNAADQACGTRLIWAARTAHVAMFFELLELDTNWTAADRNGACYSSPGLGSPRASAAARSCGSPRNPATQRLYDAVAQRLAT